MSIALSADVGAIPLAHPKYTIRLKHFARMQVCEG
jgi:hypothetical protein